MGAKLTGPACRAARALLGWSMRNLREASGVSLPTIQSIEAGGEFYESTAAKIVGAFRRHNVEITNGDSTGARFLRSYRGTYRVIPAKAGTGFAVRFEPSGYAPPRTVSGFESDAAAKQWIKDRQASAIQAVDRSVLKLTHGHGDPIVTLLEVLKLFEGLDAADLPEGERQDLVGQALALVRSRGVGDAPMSAATEADYQNVRRLMTLSLIEGHG